MWVMAGGWGYGWWKPAASKMQPLQDMKIRDDPKKGACNPYITSISDED